MFSTNSHASLAGTKEKGFPCLAAKLSIYGATFVRGRSDPCHLKVSTRLYGKDLPDTQKLVRVREPAEVR